MSLDLCKRAGWSGFLNQDCGGQSMSVRSLLPVGLMQRLWCTAMASWKETRRSLDSALDKGQNMYVAFGRGRNVMKARARFLVGAAVAATFAFASNLSASATSVGDILVCYACNTTGNAAVDAALAANPGVVGDGILFAFENTSGTA